jgi:hypothetical protein
MISSSQNFLLVVCGLHVMFLGSCINISVMFVIFLTHFVTIFAMKIYKGYCHSPSVFLMGECVLDTVIIIVFVSISTINPLYNI